MSPPTRSVLIVGDVMIDRTWLVGDTTPGTTSTPHFDIEPRRLIHPEFKDDVLGGAGTATRWMLAADSHVRVTILGAWAVALDPNQLVPKQPEKPAEGQAQRSVSGQLKAAALFATSFTTTKWRLFEYDPNGRPLLFERFDRDLRESDYTNPCSESVWPSLDAVAMVLVDDFDKGLLRQSSVCKSLMRYHGKPFVVRTKGGNALSLPWTLLVCSITDVFRFAKMEATPLPVTAIKPRDGIHPDLIAAIKEAVNKVDTSAGRSLYVMLDAEGGLLVDGGNITVHTLDQAQRQPIVVGARDCFLAYAVRELAANKEVREATKLALRAATLCSKGGANPLQEGEKCYVHAATQSFDDARLQSVVVEEASATLSLAFPVSLEDIFGDNRIRLRDADWYLPGYRTANESHGHDVATALWRIRRYRAKPEDRPLVIAIAAPPGAGKSRLAKCLADAAGCEFVFDRVDAWSAVEDLYHLCERLRTSNLRDRVPLAFLDEVDAQVFGQEIYARLLAPLWDRYYFLRGEERRLGNCVFVLAGSGNAWQTAVADNRKTCTKLDDLMSRVEVRLAIPRLSERPPDAAYFVATELRRQYPRVKSISRAVLKALSSTELPQEARSLERAVAALELEKSEETVTREQVKRKLRNGALGEITLPAEWDRLEGDLELAD